MELIATNYFHKLKKIKGEKMADNKNVSRTLKIHIDGEEVEGSVKNIQGEVRRLTGEMKQLAIGSDEYNKKAKKIRELKGILAEHRRNIQAVGEEYKTLGSRIGAFREGVNKYMGAVAGAIGAVTGLTVTVKKSVDQFAQMQEAEAQVQKYTGMTAEQVARLNETFKKMDTRTSREELNALAGDAGRLGITSQQAIEEFVDGADKIRVALGDDLGENAVRDIGKLAQMFGEDAKMGLRGAMLATGSAVNELAQNSSAGAGAIVEFAARLAGVAQQAGMTQAQIMGIGSVMDQNMQEIPTSATVISQLITKMMQDTGRFAKLAGEDVKTFSDLLKTDANAALVKFLESMKSRGGFADMAKMFDEMKMDGTRAVGVLSALAGHLDQLREAQELATNAYAEGTSVINEFNVQNSTVQAGLDKAKKQLTEISVELGQKLLPIMQAGITSGGVALKLVSQLVTFISRYAVTIASLTTAIGALTIARNKDIIVAKLQTFWNEKVVVSFVKLKAAIATNPWTALLMVLTAVVGVLIDLARRTDDAAKAQATLNDIKKQATKDMVEEEQKIRTLIAAAKDETMALNDRWTAVNELNKIIPEYNAQIDETTGKYNASKQALDRYLVSLRKKYELEGAKDTLRELGKERADARRERVAAEKALSASESAGSGYSYTTSWGMVGNTAVDSRGQLRSTLERLKRKEAAIDAQMDAITDIYGADLEKDAVSNVETNTGGGGGGGGGGNGGGGGGGKGGRGGRGGTKTDPDAERRKQVHEEQLRIETEYLKKRNEITRQYVEDQGATEASLQERLEELEMERLEKELNILGLEEHDKEKIISEMYEIRKTWKEREVETMSEIDQKELDEQKRHLEKIAAEEEKALQEMEDTEKKRFEMMSDIAKQFGTSFGEMMGGFFEDGKLRFGDFLRDILKLTIDALEKTMVAAIAERTIKNVATLGFAGMLKASGEIAAITAAFETAKGLLSSFDVGGFTGRGDWDEPRGVVHANEFVANRHALNNPSLMPVLSLIDAAQRSGSVGNLTSADVMSVLPATVGGVGSGGGGSRELLSMLAEVRAANRRLLVRLNEPIVAETYATGKRGVNEAQGLVEKMKRNVKRA